MLQRAEYVSKQKQCRGCENQCTVTQYKFNNGNYYYSGNRCEKIFSNEGNQSDQGINVYSHKTKLLFDRKIDIVNPFLTIGIPRCLNMYEEYPFWHTLFTHCGIQVYLSETSTFNKYEVAAKIL